jgi:hypothetical protein
MTCWKFFGFLMVFVFFSAQAPVHGGELDDSNCVGKQELVWAASDGLRHEIYSSSCANREWTEPVKITDNNADNLHPVIDIAADGTKWLFWSAVRPDGISIEYAVNRQGEWGDPEKLPMEQHSAIAPSILLEAGGTVWLVWAGNDGGNDEIFFSRYLKGSWTEPALVHAANEVPDVKPEIGFNEEGAVEVSWLGFRDNQYKALFVTHSEDKGWSAEQEKVIEDEDADKEEPIVVLPAFVPDNSQSFLKLY